MLSSNWRREASARFSEASALRTRRDASTKTSTPLRTTKSEPLITSALNAAVELRVRPCAIVSLMKIQASPTAV